MKTQIVPTDYLDRYLKKQRISLDKHIDRLKEQAKNGKTLESAVSKAAVYSSMIEGNPIGWDQYLLYKSNGIVKDQLLYRETPEIEIALAAFYSCKIEGIELELDDYLHHAYPWMKTNTRYFAEINDLIEAYKFAMTHTMTQGTLYRTHEILSRTLIGQEEYRGKIRRKEAGVFKGKVLIYAATPPSEVETEMNKLFRDMETFIKGDLSTAEIFHYASMIALVFIHIHPFVDGNGRAARLLDKWFLAQKLGMAAWLIPSEKLYLTRIRKYYENINLGTDYDHVNYELSIPFLLMLPMALTEILE